MNKTTWLPLAVGVLGVALAATGSILAGGGKMTVLSDRQCASLAGGVCGGIRCILVTSVCANSQTACVERLKTDCATHWEKVRQDGLSHWFCGTTPPDLSPCTASDNQVCRIDYDCFVITTGCGRKTTGGDKHESTTGCEDANGKHGTAS